ncbi:unnamed protein product, partial [Mesorhabditis spiculigera]
MRRRWKFLRICLLFSFVQSISTEDNELERVNPYTNLPRPSPVETVPTRDPDPPPGSDRTRRQSDEEEKVTYAFGHSDYLLPENFKTLRRQDIPVTYRLHDDLLRYYR